MSRASCRVLGAVILTGAATGGFLLTRLPERPRGEANSGNTLVQELRRAEELLARHRKAVRRGQQFQRVAWDLVHGRLTLVKAAARVRDLDRQIGLDPAIYRLQMRAAFPADSLEESLCRKVISLVRLVVADRPRWAGAVRRLEGELADHLARHRRVRREMVPNGDSSVLSKSPIVFPRRAHSVAE